MVYNYAIKICDSWPISCYISETKQDAPKVTEKH